MNNTTKIIVKKLVNYVINLLKQLLCFFNKMLEIDFNLFDHNFCEATLYSTGQHPEYLNAISSLFITFVGLNGMRKPHLTFLLSLVYACLSVNGVLSFLYHYYNSIGYGLLDRMSMVLLALNTTYMFVQSLKNEHSIILSNTRNILLHVTIISYYSMLLTVAGLHKEILFNIMFALFLGSIVYYMYKIHLLSNNTVSSSAEPNNLKFIALLNKIPLKIHNIGWKGVRYIVYSGIFWLSTEALCYQFSFIKYLFGHVWWHVFVSYGGYMVSIVPHYIHMVKYQDDMIVYVCYDIFGFPYLDYNNIV